MSLRSYPFQHWRRIQYEERDNDIENKKKLASCGALGPGAEPPVAVASHAFAHEGLDESREVRDDPCAEGGRRNDSTSKMVESSINIDYNCSPSEHERGREDDDHCEMCDDDLAPDSFNNEEAETLADCYEVLEDVGPEGAQTARRGEVFAPPASSLQGMVGQDQSDRQSSTGSNATEREFSTRYESGSSEDELSAPYQWQHQASCNGKRVKQRLFSVNRNRRIAPFESDSIVEGQNRSKHVRSRTRKQGSIPRRSWRTEPLRRQPRQRRPKRSTKKAESDGEGQQFRRDTSTLRQGNKTKGSARLRRSGDGHGGLRSSDTSPSRVWNSASESRRQDDSTSWIDEHSKARMNQKIQSRHRHNYDRNCEKEPCLAPSRDEERGAPQTIRRSATFESSSTPEPSPKIPEADGPGSFEAETSNTANICLPRILAEGGFLWKVPYHQSGVPKCRWFQIKPSEGLLTTPSGRLLIRPRGREGGIMGPASTISQRDCDSDLEICHLDVAWPLTLMWMDPDKNLEKNPPREMDFGEVVEVRRGHATPAFWQQAVHRGVQALPAQELCFSLIGYERTLDLAAGSVPEAKQWVRAFAALTLGGNRGQVARCNRYAPPFSADERSIRWNFVQGGLCDLESADSQSFRSSPVSPGMVDLTGSTSRSNGREWLHQAGPQRQSRPVYQGSDGSTTVMPKKGLRSSKTIRAWRRQLFPAILRGDAAAVVDLFDQGCPADVVQPGTGDTALLLACRVGDVDITRECLRRGSRNDPHAAFGQTALQAAVAAGKEKCARLLLETAAPSLSDGIMANDRDPHGRTPLHVACRCGHVGIVQALLDHGADINAMDREGKTAMHWAASDGHTGALACVIDAGGDAHLEEKDLRGNRPLHAAATSGHIACVQLLLETAVDPDVPNTEGRTPFALASIGGHLAVTRLIRKYAPAAGTYAGGDALAQELSQRGEGGGISTPDVLPRPHATGWTSTSYHSYQSSSSKSRREIVDSCTGFRYPRSDESAYRTLSRPTPNSAHGSLFDGLHVYVSGERQPSSSYQGALIGGVGSLQSHDQQEEGSGLPERHTLNPLTTALSAVVPPPPVYEASVTHVAPRPPSPSMGIVMPWVSPATALPGSARALARAIHFGSVSTNRAVDMVKTPREIENSHAASTEGGDGRRHEAAVGNWMRSGERDVAIEADIAKQCVFESGKELSTSLKATEHELESVSATVDVDDANESFVLSGSGPLAGLWYVGYSQGYPYYLHEPSGNSQWEDPRLPVTPGEDQSYQPGASPGSAEFTEREVSSATSVELQQTSGDIPLDDTASGFRECSPIGLLGDRKALLRSPVKRGRVHVGEEGGRTVDVAEVRTDRKNPSCGGRGERGNPDEGSDSSGSGSIDVRNESDGRGASCDCNKIEEPDPEDSSSSKTTCPAGEDGKRQTIWGNIDRSHELSLCLSAITTKSSDREAQSLRRLGTNMTLDGEGLADGQPMRGGRSENESCRT